MLYDETGGNNVVPSGAKLAGISPTTVYYVFVCAYAFFVLGSIGITDVADIVTHAKVLMIRYAGGGGEVVGMRNLPICRKHSFQKDC